MPATSADLPYHPRFRLLAMPWWLARQWALLRLGLPLVLSWSHWRVVEL